MLLNIEATITKSDRSSKTLRSQVNINYNNETWRECEAMIRDAFHNMANSYIDREFYKVK